VLTPLVIDPGHPFPHLKNKSINLGVVFESNRDESGIGFAVVQVPQISARLVDTSGVGNSRAGGSSWKTSSRRNLSGCSSRAEDLSVAPFRVTRNWDLEIDEEEADDLLATIQQELRRRDRGNAVRLEVASASTPASSLSAPCAAPRRGRRLRVDGPLNLGDLMSVASAPTTAPSSTTSPSPRRWCPPSATPRTPSPS
jgi:polyphosphate kinase